MKYSITLKFNKHSKMKVEIEARDRKELQAKIQAHPELRKHNNGNRLEIKPCHK